MYLFKYLPVITSFPQVHPKLVASDAEFVFYKLVPVGARFSECKV
ncbi:hypothetical protein ACVBIL_12775 [Shewanella sp. 125m-7]